MNPILLTRDFVPDAEARQWNDGRIYIYGSYDISGNTSYCSKEYRVFSSDNLIEWIDHGISFTTDQISWLDEDVSLYAPDCIYKDGMYYLYFCLSNKGEGVAVSRFPEGPFTSAVQVEGAHGDSIDPAVLNDDDGSVYLFWGQHHLRGARLNSDMKSIDVSTLDRSLLNETEHGFHEGASIRKNNGIYYMLYTDTSRGKATCLAYATSSSPLGPYTKRGIIIDNDGCDLETWNNHGSIAEFGGQWYLFYHRSSQASKYSRRVCIEPIHFLADGSIEEVEMTTQGVSGPLDACSEIEAYRACLLSGKVRTEPLASTEALECGEFLSYIENGNWAAYKYIDFGEGMNRFVANTASLTYGGKIEIRIDSWDGPILGTCVVERTVGWEDWRNSECSISKTAGVHAVYLIFRGRKGRLFSLKSFTFEP